MKQFKFFLVLAIAMAMFASSVFATALTDDKAVTVREGGRYRLPVAASTTIYGGALVGLNGSGYIIAGTTSGCAIMGVAIEQVNNASGSAGAKYCDIACGISFKLTSSGLSAADEGKMAYCTDDQTFTLTPNAVPIGIVVDYESATSAWVYIPYAPLWADQTNIPLTSPYITTAILDANGNEEIGFTATASAVNHIGLTNAATGNSPDIKFTGDNTNVNGTITTKGAGDITITAGDDAAVQSGPLASDLVTLSGYDVDGTAYDSNIVVTAGNTPTITLQADGGTTVNSALTLSDAAGTGSSLVGAVAGQDITVTSGDDLVLKSYTAASDLVKLQGYDVNATAYDDNVVVTSANDPTITLQADGGLTVNAGITLSDAAGTGGSVIGCVSGQDVTITSGDDATVHSGVANADLVTIGGYDVDGAVYDSNVVVTSANDPTVTVQADGGIALNGGLTLSNAAGTGASVVGAVSGQNMTVTSGNDLTLRSSTAASDLVTISGYDVDGTAYDSNILITSANDPTIAIQADGGIALNGGLTLSDAAGTGNSVIGVPGTSDITVTSGDDMTLKSGTSASDIVAVQGYDVDGTAYKSMVLVTSANTPSVMLGTEATDLVGFFGVGPAARASAITQTYATADATHANRTVATLTDSTGGAKNNTLEAITGGGADKPDNASAAELNGNFAELAEEINALAADQQDTAQLLNSVIDMLQAYGLCQ